LIKIIKNKIFTIKFLKFILVGFWNTFFGTAVFSLLYYLFGNVFHYIFLVIISNILAITNAYVFYKFFVFKSKGNYLKEYLKFYVVYGVVFGVSLLLFPVFMEIIFPLLEVKFSNFTFLFKYKPYLSQLCVTGFTMFISYFGHERFSYKRNALESNFDFNVND